MSLRTNSLVEGIRDLRDQSASAGPPDQAARGALGREVLQALHEIDRVATTATRGPGRLARPANHTLTDQLSAVLAGSATSLSNAGARNATSLIGTATASGSTSRRGRRA